MINVKTKNGIKSMTEEQYKAYCNLTQPEKTYQQKRMEEYPGMGDQLDAIMKWAFTEKEIGLPDELKSLAGKCMAIKGKYPKD